jgi:hypothetical protein
VEGQEVRVVLIVRTAQAILMGSADYGNQVIALEQPVGILEAMMLGVRVVQHGLSHAPVPQVR